MKLPVGKLKNVPGEMVEFSLTLTRACDGVLAHAEDLVFSGKAENAQRTIRVEGEIKGILSLPCDRCGESFSFPVEAVFSEGFTNQAIAEGEDLHQFQGDEIDLLPYVEQAVFLEIPMKILCKEDCRGLCPSCGKNLNEGACACENTITDPRLAVLGALLDEGFEEEGGVKNGCTKGKDL